MAQFNIIFPPIGDFYQKVQEIEKRKEVIEEKLEDESLSQEEEYNLLVEFKQLVDKEEEMTKEYLSSLLW